MRPRTKSPERALLVGVVLAIATGAGGIARAEGILEPCRLEGLDEAARCGEVVVPENPQDPAGRTIALRVAVLPARDEPALPEPIVFLAGGPGQAASEQASFVATLFERPRQRRDVLLVDLRGTGGSNPLRCSMHDFESDLDAVLRDMFPPPAVAACRRQLEGKADLRQYTTRRAVEDLERVRSALGYPRLDLFGTSYGVRVALDYLRRFPDRVRTATLKSPYPFSARMTEHYGRDAQRALELLLADCRMEPSCRAAFPSLRRDLESVLDRLDRAPARVQVEHPTRGGPIELAFDRGRFVETIRSLLYQPFSAARLPGMIQRAAAGDLRPFAELTLRAAEGIQRGLYLGFFFSVTCTEDLPFVDVAAVAEARATTFYRDYRYRQQRAVCGEWPRGEVPAGFFEPVSSDRPVLLVSGGLDPVLPPAWGEAVARTLPASLHVIVRNAGHSFANMQGCVDEIVADFLEMGTTDGLDIACVGRIRRPPFELPEP